MEITEELKKEKAKCIKRINKIDKQIEDLKFVDGWYRYRGYPDYFMYFYNGGIFGIDTNGKWIDIDNYEVDRNYYTLATPEEVETRLTKFAKELGYREGVTIIRLIEGSEHIFKKSSLTFGYSTNNYPKKIYYISFGGCIIWRSDKGWAKIVEQKPKYTVKPNMFGFGGNEVLSDFTILKQGNIIDLNEILSTAKRIEEFLNN